MFRIYYDQSTGQIIKACSRNIAKPTQTLPYVDVQTSIRMCDYRVNIETQQLIHEPMPHSVIKR